MDVHQDDSNGFYGRVDKYGSIVSRFPLDKLLIFPLFLSVKYLPAIFRRKHDVILAIPFRMR